jgi:hypothetical protein
VKRAEWIDELQEAFADLTTAVKAMTGLPQAYDLPAVPPRRIYDDAVATIVDLFDHPPDDDAPAAADAPSPGLPADAAAAHRRHAKRTLLRFFNRCLPSAATHEIADEIESIVDDIVEAAVLEIHRAEIAARIEATPTPR